MNCSICSGAGRLSVTCWHREKRRPITGICACDCELGDQYTKTHATFSPLLKEWCELSEDHLMHLAAMPQSTRIERNIYRKGLRDYEKMYRFSKRVARYAEPPPCEPDIQDPRSPEVEAFFKASRIRRQRRRDEH